MKMENTAILKNYNISEIITKSTKEKIVPLRDTAELLYVNQDYIMKFYKSFNEFVEKISQKYNLDYSEVSRTLDDIIFKSVEKREELHDLYLSEKKFIDEIKNLTDSSVVIVPSSYFSRDRFSYPLNYYLKHKKYFKKLTQLYKKVKSDAYILLFPCPQFFKDISSSIKNNGNSYYAIDNQLIKNMKPTKEEKILKAINQEILVTKYAYLLQTLREKNSVDIYHTKDKIFEKIIKESEEYIKHQSKE